MSDIKLGCHVGMAGKDMFLASAREAASYGANVFMLYTGAPQNTRRKEISELNIDAGWEYAHEHGINEIVVHAPYIINLANTVKPETYELAVEFLEKEIVRTAAMKSRILVLHPGSHVNAGEQAGIAQIVKGLNTVLNQNDDDVFIALETMAGKGSEIGRSFEELKEIYDGVDRKERLRVCFDTCHVNDAGYDIVNHYDEVQVNIISNTIEEDYNLCLYSKAFIKLDGSVYPCNALKYDHIGNIKERNLGKIAVNLEEVWKDKSINLERC